MMYAGLTRLQLDTLTGPDPQQYDDMLHSMSELQQSADSQGDHYTISSCFDSGSFK